MNAYHVSGIILASWAVLVSFLGITRENFPSTASAARLVGAVSVVLVLLTISMAIYTGAHEKKKDEKKSESAALRHT